MKTPGVAFLIPVLRRPHRVAPLLDSIEATTPEPYSVHFICDHDDLEEIQAIRADGRADSIGIVDGNYAMKINEAARTTSEPLVFLGADDLKFHPGWLEAATAKLTGEILVVGTNDLCNPRVIEGNHATHFLVDRRYLAQGTIDEPGKLLHEGYRHEFVDNELIETAKHRGVYAHAGDAIVEHLHPMAGKAPMDELYAAIPERMKQGREVFNDRKELWA